MRATIRHAALLGGLIGLAAPAPAQQADAAALAKSKNCLACHATHRNVVGPSFKVVSEKYAGKSDAVPQIAARIAAGSSGIWGPVPMPANRVSADEARQLAEWILTIK
ncbi:cytochrome C' [Corticibacter populi]|uniref:Cytochrome C n=1 Tax=Corticibacter populi TaxID=1550736 RepID=A0A3M6QYS7_9BURK|nr:c-type cytochrome [Corticibacter populi]RMX07769.1 cytochrome C' [Corticibacter populi]RZS34990.1 cytochrome c [Corticibacter populi]